MIGATGTQSAASSRLAKARPLSVSEAAFPGAQIASAPEPPTERRVSANPLSRFVSRQRPRCPDRKAARERRRMLGGSSALPETLRGYYTEGQRSVLCVVAGEVKRHGVCDLPIDRIAALAGVCRTTVQTTMHEARLHNHLKITERPCRGRKSLTNIVRIVDAEWLAWIKRAPSSASRTGSNLLKMVSSTKNIEDEKTASKKALSSEAEAFAGELAAIAGHEKGKEPEAWGKDSTAEAVQRMLDAVKGRTSILSTRPPMEILRSLTVEIANRRKAVGDAPRSPRYFEAAINRIAVEGDWDAAKSKRTGAARPDAWSPLKSPQPREELESHHPRGAEKI